MSEVSARPAASRGRGSIRSGRGGLSSRGALRSAPRSNGEAFTEESSISQEDQGELGQLKKQYSNQLSTLKELFPDWTDDDLVFALQETGGDLSSTIERISEGSVSRFADVKKKTKERKTKDTFGIIDPQSTSTRGRGGRGGFEGGRAGRGRGGERGRGGSRGGRGGAMVAPRGTNAPTSSAVVSEPTTWGTPVESLTAPGAWVEQPSTTAAEGTPEGQWTSAKASEATPATASEGVKSSLIPEGATKSWASMLAQAKVPQIFAKIAQMTSIGADTQQPAEPVLGEASVSDKEESVEEPAIAEDLSSLGHNHIGDGPAATSASDETEAIAVAELAPPADKLTADNVERLPDTSVPPPTETAASTVDASSVIGSGTPYGSTQQVPTLGRPPMGGYATTAWKATGTPGRSTSFQRMMEQREAVVMPGNHAVDRAAVQFGQMGLNGDSSPLDVDEDREDTETRTQPPQHSPPPQPKTSLPPAQQHGSIGAELPSAQDSFPTPKPAPGLPLPSQASSQTASAQQLPSMPPGIGQPYGQGAQAYGQFSRYGAGSSGPETSAAPPKPYDPFSQQLNYPVEQGDNNAAGQPHPQAQAQTQSHLGSFGQGQNDYGQSQYGGEQQRAAFQSYYGSSYGQQSASTQQENAPPQRTPSGFGANDYPSGTGQPAPGAGQSGQGQSRFGETASTEQSGSVSHVGSQQPAGPVSQQGQPQHQQAQGQHGPGSGYPYGNPYYGGSYYGTYMNQQYPNYQYNQQGYGAPYGGKGGMYGQVHHGYAPQSSYEQSATPGAAGSATNSSLQGRESGFGGGFNEYGRATSAQTQGQQQSSNYISFPSDHQEGFGRSPSTMASQYSQQPSDSTLKPFPEQKSGASPNTAPPGRTGSATNTGNYGATQSNFPPPQSQSGFGGYPSHMNQVHGNHGSQYGGFGGLGGQHQGSAQSHQGGGYGGGGNYGAGGFGGNSYGNYTRGGWGGNYGH